MNLIRFHRTDSRLSPVYRLHSLRDEIDRLFDNPFGNLFPDVESFTGWTPALDVYEDKDHVVVKAELPGLKKEDIELSLHENALTISGERKSEQTERDETASRTERFAGRFQRTIALPKPVGLNKATARDKNGILTVTLAKTEESKP
jgi:HSP20 family protein